MHANELEASPEQVRRLSQSRARVDTGGFSSNALPGGSLAALSPSSLLHLQRMAGNQSVNSLLDQEQEASPVHDVIGSGGGSPLDSQTRGFMEERLGSDFGDVRVHTGAGADESARSINAQAYTVGTDVVFQSGKYEPDSDSGRHMLAHELTHVVQQKAGPVAGTPAPGGIMISHPSDAFEQAAERSAERVTAQPFGTGAAAAAGAASVQRQEDEDEPDEAATAQTMAVQRTAEDQELSEETE
jgi:hypothetical protein